MIEIGNNKINNAEVLLKAIYNDSPIGIAVYDSNGNLIDLNQSCMEIFGVSSKNGIRSFDLLDGPNIPKEYLSKLNKRETISYEKKIDFDSTKEQNFFDMSKSGKIYINVLITPLFLGEDKFISTYLVHVQDISNQKITQKKLINLNEDLNEKLQKKNYQLSKPERYFQILIENLNDIITVIDERGQVEYINEDTHKKIMGYSSKDVVFKNAFELIHPEDRRKVVAEFKNALKHGEGLIETRIYHRDGHYLWTETNGKKFIDEDGNTKILTISRNIDERKKIEYALRESEEKFRIISDQSLVGIVIAQFGKIKYVNKQMERLCGYSLEEMKNWKADEFLKIIHPDFREIVAEQSIKKQIGLADVVNKYQIKGIKKSGENIWVENYSKTITYQGNPAVFSILIDITDKKEAEQKLKESEQKFRTIAEQSALGIIIQQNNDIKFANKTFAEIIEYPLEKINTWTLDEIVNIIHEDDLHIVKERSREREEGDYNKTINYECRVITRSGIIKWLDVTSKPIEYMGKYSILISLIDITARKKIEEELKEVSRLKSELLSRTSHELKTPLVSIKGYTDLILNQHYEMLDIFTISILNEIKQGCYRLESLIKDLLETSKLESEEIQLIKLEEDLAFLIRFCIRDLKGLIKTRNHHLILDIHNNMITFMEKERIYEVVMNLLSNAIKYTPPYGQISIKSEIKDDYYIISVKDNGIGLTKDEKEKIFKKFGKIERYGKGLDVVSEGSGLGLYISKKIIELHGGEIWVESEGRDKGSTFYFSLPVARK